MGGMIDPGVMFSRSEGVLAGSWERGDDRSVRPPEGDPDLTFEVRDLDQLVAELDGEWKALLEWTPFSERQFKDLRQAVMEMAANALEWGCGDDRKRWALVMSWVGTEDVTVIVRDRGPGFDPSSVPPRGFGIMLARGLVDRFSYDERGNEVTMVKRFVEEPHR